MSASTITVNTQKQERVYFLWAMTLLLVIAVAIRLVFFRGLFGSDDFTYIVRALEIASGEWTSSNYNGALRYGFNIPAGLFLALFGPNIFAANLFSFLCSLGEVALVGWFARSQWGIRTGLIAAAIITVLPLHVSAASNIHVDPIVAFFITLSFVLFWFAEKKRSKQHYFLTGLSMGFVFWARELIIVYLAVFLIYALVERRLDWRWMYIFWGGFVLLLGHLLLMLFITGDPFHGFKVYFMQIGRDFIGGSKETGAFYYLGYLFRDLRHTWILAYLALGGLVVTWRDRRSNVASSDRFLLVWLLGMLVIFSFTPISLWPFQFITKQSNYLNIFFAPLCLVAARFLAGFSMRWLTITLTITMLGGFALSGLSQQEIGRAHV